MNDRDKIAALWLNLEMTLNALEELGEEVMFLDTPNDYSFYGKVGWVRWNEGARKWAVVRS